MTAPETADGARPPVIVKKYANRRLYNTETSSYITLDTLADLVRHDRDFVVYDARSGEDITRSVLTQIIVEEEAKGQALLPTTFLRQLIGFYGDSLGAVVPRYLEQTMTLMARQQQQMRAAMRHTMGSLLPPALDEMGRQNVAMMERAMTLFAPFYRPDQQAEATPPDHEPTAGELEALRHEVERLRAALASRSAPPDAGDDAADCAIRAVDETK